MRHGTSADAHTLDASSGSSHWRSGLCVGWLIVLALYLTSPSLEAQQGVIDKRMVLSVLPEFGVVRGQAPVATSVSLRWNSSELVEGRLQLEWFVDTTRLGRYVSTELALSDSTVRLNVELPPIVLPYDDATTSVQGKFITDGTVYDLGEHDVAVQPDWRRILVAAVCTKPRSPEARMSGLETKQPNDRLPGDFRLEPFFENQFTKRELLVQNAEVDPDDVPTDPLKMTAFDLFIVPAESIAKLKPRQLECLLTWVRAGGSLCVFVDSAVPETHVAWLNQLAGRDVTDAAYVRGADGHILAVDGEVDRSASSSRRSGQNGHRLGEIRIH